jgi:hypothetical protein
VYSAFSLEQFKQGKKVLRCPNGTPWTWCLNKRCTVDPSDPKKAICVCDGLRTEEWITLGGQLRHRHLQNRILVRRKGKGLQRSDLLYGKGTWPRLLSREMVPGAQTLRLASHRDDLCCVIAELVF